MTKLYTYLLLLSIIAGVQKNQIQAQSYKSCSELYLDQDVQKSKHLSRKEAGKFALSTVTIVLGTALTAATFGAAIPVAIGSVVVIVVDIGLGTTTGKHMFSWGKQALEDRKLYTIIRSASKFQSDQSRGQSFKKFFQKHRLDTLGITLEEAADGIIGFNQQKYGLCQVLNADNGSAAGLSPQGSPFFLFYPERVFVENLKYGIKPSLLHVLSPSNLPESGRYDWQRPGAFVE